MIRRAAIPFIMLLFASPAFAHAIRMKVEVTDSHVQATVRYDGADEDGGEVEIQLLRREPLQEIAKLKPGSETRATFPRPEPGQYRMIARDDFGHRVVVDFEVPQPGSNVTAASGERNNWPTLIGLAIITVVAVFGWWLAQRKKQHGS